MGNIGPIKREREYEPIEEPHVPAVPSEPAPMAPSEPSHNPVPLLPERHDEPVPV